MADNYYHYGNDAVETFVKQLTEELSAQLKLLLEEKHLYQKFKVEPTTIFSEVLKRVKDNEVRSWVEAAIQPILNGRLTLSSGALHLVLKRTGVISHSRTDVHTSYGSIALCQLWRPKRV